MSKLKLSESDKDELLNKNSIYIEIDVNKIIPHPTNPNKMPQETFKRLKKSITKLGLLNPIIVRDSKLKKKHYEVIDGEWRWRAHKGLGLDKILAKVIKMKDEDIPKIFFATGIKGRYDAYKTLDIINKLSETEKDLDAYNLGKHKVKKLTKYTDLEGMGKGIPVKLLKDEKMCSDCYPIENFTTILPIPVKPENYDKIIKKMKQIDTNLGIALLKLLEI